MTYYDDINVCTSSGDSEIDFRQLDSVQNTLAAKTYEHTDSFIAIIRVILVILLRVGFLLIQIGSIPITDVNLILLQNVLDICWVSIVFMFLGAVIAYTGDLGGIMGRFYWIGDREVNKHEVIIGWQAVMITSAICTTCIAGRVRTTATFIIGLIVCGILQPFIIHWTWADDGWMSYNFFRNRKVMFRDYGGSTVVHIVGGLAGFAGCLILGRRLLKLQDIDKTGVSNSSVGTSLIGHFFIILGLQSLMLSNNIRESEELIRTRLPSIVINNLLSISSCTIVVTVAHLYMHKSLNHWMMIRCIQAATAGIVIISAGADDYSPPVSLLLGCLGGALFYLVSRYLFETSLEDYCNIVAIHIICALLGSLVAPFFHEPPKDRPSLSTTFFHVFIDSLWNFVCIIVIFVLVFVVMVSIFIFLDHYGLLRNESEVVHHSRSNTIVQQMAPRTVWKRLFDVDTRTIYLEPGNLSYHDLVNISGPSQINNLQSEV